MVRPWVKQSILIVAAAFVLSQFFPVQRDNPPVDPAHTLYTATPVPADIHAIFDRSCRDCHSHETVWPWYSHLAPVSWVIANDVHGGRKHFNISEWNTYPDEKKARKFGDICEQVKSGEMPDSKYTFIHQGTGLNADQRTAICNWAESARKAMNVPPSATPAPAPHGQ